MGSYQNDFASNIDSIKDLESRMKKLARQAATGPVKRAKTRYADSPTDVA